MSGSIRPTLQANEVELIVRCLSASAAELGGAITTNRLHVEVSYFTVDQINGVITRLQAEVAKG